MSDPVEKNSAAADAKATKSKPAPEPVAQPEPTGDRQSRLLETREAEDRVPTDWRPSSLLPDPVPTPGWTYRWIRLANGASTDQRNVALRFREGWRPVSPSEQPEIAVTMSGGGRGEDRIVIGELMLCKAPQQLIAQRTAHYQRQSDAQMDGVMSQLMSKSDARMPILNPAIHSETKGNI